MGGSSGVEPGWTVAVLRLSEGFGKAERPLTFPDGSTHTNLYTPLGDGLLGTCFDEGRSETR